MSALPAVSLATSVRACVLITPSRDADFWRDRVHQAIAEAKCGWDVLVTSDVDAALGHHAEHWAILMPDFDAGGDVALLNNRTRDISRALAVAVDSPGTVTIIDEALISTRAPVELLPGTPLDTTQAGAAGSGLGPVPGPLAFYQTGRPFPGATATWPLDLLHTVTGADQGFSSDLSFDMTGKARILAWGPHIMLSRGRWQMDLEFEVDERGAKTILGIDWGSLSSHTRLEGRPTQPGIHRATIRHSWRQAEIAELRVGLSHGAFSGKLRLRSLVITSVAT